MKSQKLKKACLIVAGVALALVFAIRLMAQRHWLSRLPSGLNVTKILYVAEESWGFGPGGNETGVVLYELPENTVRQLKERGIDSLYGGAGWSTTPMNRTGKWFKTIDGDMLAAPSLDNFLDQYGFGIPVDPAITKSINKALAKPGSYFAYTRTGMVILMPSEHRVAYVYAG
jgi:hypothetical protein